MIDDHRRERFIAANGCWSDSWATVLACDPIFFDRCVALMEGPARMACLDEPVRDLIRIAITIACTNIDAEACRGHVRVALDRGVDPADIREVIALVSVLGIHSCNIGIPMLMEEYRKTGGQSPASPDPERRAAIKQRFVELRGYWSPLWDDLLDLAPGFFESYTEFSSFPALQGRLAPKVRELIYIAIDIATHHLFEPGTRVHIINALGLGASVGEIAEVIQLVSLLGLRSVPIGFSILDEEIVRRGPAA